MGHRNSTGAKVARRMRAGEWASLSTPILTRAGVPGRQRAQRGSGGRYSVFRDFLVSLWRSSARPAIRGRLRDRPASQNPAEVQLPGGPHRIAAGVSAAPLDLPGADELAEQLQVGGVRRVGSGGQERGRQCVVVHGSAASQKARPSVKDGLGVVAGSRCSSARRRIAVPVARNSVACSPHTWLETATFTPTIPEACASIAAAYIRASASSRAS